MTIRATHEIHERRASRNFGVAATLVLFIGLVFGLTVVKVTNGDPMQAFDHVMRPELLTVEDGQ